MSTSANKQDEHMSAGATASAVRRSPRCSARRGTAAVMGKTAEEEGDGDSGERRWWQRFDRQGVR